MSSEEVTPVRQAVSRVYRAGYQVSREYATLLTNAFGLVAALAWSDALKNLFARVRLFLGWPLLAPFALAAMITIAAYAASVAMARLVKPQCTTLCTPDNNGGGGAAAADWADARWRLKRVREP